MKKIIFLLVGIMLLNINNLSAKQDNIKNGVEKNTTQTVFCGLN